jgi:SAM-dependent methyltransferase
MTTPRLDPYDEFIYNNYSYPQTHIDRLATLATFLGLKPAPPENARVLELACGDGSNLLPMAYGLPQSQFVGIDRAAKPIKKGQEAIEDLRLKNMKLWQRDLLTVTREEIGEFDYIIAHGLYSWVPEPVRDRLLEICSSSLKPQGVAYVSYNVYPGCRQREIIRDMMLFHTREVKDQRERVAQSRALIQWMAEAQAKTKAYSLLLQETKDFLDQSEDGAIHHDIIAEHNTPVYFYEFMTHAAEHGLQFLSEAEHFNVREYQYTAEVANELRSLARHSILTKEQYLDFLSGRSFRQTLLCHHDVAIEHTFEPQRIREFYLSSAAQPGSTNLDLNSDEPEKFHAPEDASATTNFPLAKAALFYLGQIYPRAVRFDDLLAEAGGLLGPASPLNGAEGDQAERMLAELLIRIYGVGVVEFHLHVPQFTVVPGERPLASSLARFQARLGPMTTSLFGNNVRFEDFLGRQFLLLLDGTRDRAALLRDFREVIRSQPQADDAETDKVMRDLPEQLEEKLLDLGRRGFLLA